MNVNENDSEKSARDNQNENWNVSEKENEKENKKKNAIVCDHGADENGTVIANVVKNHEVQAFVHHKTLPSETRDRSFCFALYCSVHLMRFACQCR
jgi:hypothetical protein